MAAYAPIDNGKWLNLSTGKVVESIGDEFKGIRDSEQGNCEKS